MREGAELGGYRLEARLGQGGMGVVWRASHPGFPGVSFAVKVLPSDLDLEARARFEREMQALAAVSDHPNVVRVHGGRLEPVPWFAMELVLGPNLAKLARSTPLEPTRAARLVRGVARAVAHAHARGVLHRDLKPENVLVSEGDRARVCDFGLAALAGAERLTRTSVSLGTVGFSAPEQLDGRARDADARADVYGLGSVLFFALTGRAPFVGDGLGLLKRVLSEPAPAPSSLAPGVPAALDALCRRALEKDPARRFESAHAFGAELDRFLGVEPGPAPARLEPGPEPRARPRGAAALGVALAAALVLAGVVLVPLVLRARGRAAALARARVPGASAAEVGAALDQLEALHASDAELEEGRALLVTAGEKRWGLGRAPRDYPATAEFVLQFLEQCEARLALFERHGIDAATKARMEREIIRYTRVGLGMEGPRIDQRVPDTAVRRALDLARVLGGERSCELGDALVESGRFAEAADLAAWRLAADKHDALGLWLQARLALRALGAPDEPLGRGRLGLADAATDVRLATLEKIRKDDGPLSRRAGWLRVELLVGAGREDEARDEFELMTLLDRDSPLAPAYSTILGPGSLLERFTALRPKLESPADAPAAALALARLFALEHVPDALEHPELAAGAGDAVDDAASDAADFAPRLDPAFAVRSGDRVVPGLGTSVSALAETLARKQLASALPRDPAARAESLRLDHGWLRAGLSRAPRARSLLEAAATPALGGPLLHPAFLLLLAQQDLSGLDGVAETFDEKTRALRRAEAARGFEAGDRDLPVRPYADEWDPPGESVEDRVAVFDAALAREAGARDSVLGALSNRGESGAEAWPEDTVAKAVIGVRALRMAEAILERPPGERVPDRVAFDAFWALERLHDLGGPAVLPFRAAVRRRLVPGAWGERLLLLDLERARRVCASGLDPRELAGRGLPPVRYDSLACLAAAQGAASGIAGESRTAGRTGALFALGCAWIRELAAWEVHELPATDRREAYRHAIAPREQALALSRAHDALFTGGGREELTKALEQRPEDDARLALPYAFDPNREIRGRAK